jgi:hypothetical protein
LTVTQATPQLSWDAPAAITYGTALSGTQLDATASGQLGAVAGTFAYSPAAGTILPAGSVTLSATFTPSDTADYVSGGSVSTTLQVNPAVLTVTGNNKSSNYGGTFPSSFTYTVSGFVNGQTASVITTKPTCSTTATSSGGLDTSPVGTYPVSCTGGVAANYTFSYVAGTFSVFKVALTLTAGNASVVYGAAMPTFTFTGAGYVNGDSNSSLTTQPTCTSTAKTSGGNDASGVGTYSVTCSGAVDPNYNISYAAGTLTVTPASLTITANNKSTTYGGTYPTFNWTGTGYVNGDAPGSALQTQPTCTSTATSSGGKDTSPVGTYPITCSGATSKNYTLTYVSGTFTVSKAPLTITANNQTVQQGQPMPAFTFTASGLVNGETSSVLNPQPVCSSTATSSGGNDTSPPGTYAITCSGAADPNYSITYVRGTLTVTA